MPVLLALTLLSAQTDPLPRVATATAILTTVGGAVAGAHLMDGCGNDSDRCDLGLYLTLGALVLGPSMGSFMTGAWGRGLAFSAGRAVSLGLGGLGVARAATVADGGTTPTVLGMGGLGAYLALTIADVALTPRTVRQRRHADYGYALTVSPLYVEGGFGVALGLN